VAERQVKEPARAGSCRPPGGRDQLQARPAQSRVLLGSRRSPRSRRAVGV